MGRQADPTCGWGQSEPVLEAATRRRVKTQHLAPPIHGKTHAGLQVGPRWNEDATQRDRGCTAPQPWPPSRQSSEDRPPTAPVTPSPVLSQPLGADGAEVVASKACRTSRGPGEQRPCIWGWGWRPGPMLGHSVHGGGPPKQHLLTRRSPILSLSDIRETKATAALSTPALCF